MIDTRSPALNRIDIDPEAFEVARRYIAAIVERDPLHARLGPEWALLERARLMDRFVERYAIAASGPYARRGKDALRIALGAI